MSGLTPEQHAIKKHRVSGSTCPAYLGLSPWMSPEEAWEIDMGLAEFRETDDTKAGNFMERGIGEMALERLGVPLEEAVFNPDSMLHPAYPETFVVHADLLIPSQKVGIQIKNHNSFVVRTYKGRPGDAGKWDNELVPIYYRMQCLLEQEIVQRTPWAPSPIVLRDEWTWILGAYFGGSNLRLYWIKQDPKLLRGIIEAGRAFWAKHLDPNGPQERPSNQFWVGPHRKPPQRVKLNAEELAAAPIPFGEGAEPFEVKIPFGED